MTHLLMFAINLYRNTSYRNKLIFPYLILVVIPILLLSAILLGQISRVYEKQAVKIMEQSLTQNAALLDQSLSKVSLVADTILSNRKLRNILEKKKPPIGDQITDYRELQTLVEDYMSYYSVNRIRLYVQNGLIYSNQNSITFNLDDLIDLPDVKPYLSLNYGTQYTKVYEYKRNNFNSITGLEEQVRVCSVIRTVRSLSNINQILGLICIDMLEDDLLSIMRDADFSRQGAVVIKDATGEQVCLYQSTPFAGGRWDDVIAACAGSGEWVSAGLRTAVIRSQSVNEASGWTLYSIVPKDVLLSDLSAIRNLIILIVTLTSAVIMILAYFFARHNTGRINRLAEQMKKVKNGNLDVVCLADSGDEIGVLESSFNYMVGNTRNLLWERYKMGQNIRSMELIALQAQIKPHFLYNTLDLIYWTAQENNSEKVCKIVNSLTKYYRISLSRGDDFITLKNELEHVLHYVHIQNLRFGDLFALQTDVPDELLSCRILKLILQPLVENAIMHGIMEKIDNHGLIRIAALTDGNLLILTVTDDGIGMSGDQCREILQFRTHHNPSSSGYGLKNINDRLKLYYGDGSGLRFRSIQGVMTEVTVTIDMKGIYGHGLAASRRSDDAGTAQNGSGTVSF